MHFFFGGLKIKHAAAPPSPPCCCGGHGMRCQATGGGDGAVRIWSAHEQDLDLNHGQHCLAFAPPTLPSAPPVDTPPTPTPTPTLTPTSTSETPGKSKGKGKGADFARTIAMANEHSAYVCTHQGNIYHVDPQDPTGTFKLLTHQDAFAGHNVLVCPRHADAKLCCVGSPKGHLALVYGDASSKPLQMWKGHDRAVMSMYWCQGSRLYTLNWGFYFGVLSTPLP